MTSPEQLDAYRGMTASERLELTLRAIRESTPYLLLGSPEVVRRRFERIRMENDARNRSMLEALARSRPETS